MAYYTQVRCTRSNKSSEVCTTGQQSFCYYLKRGPTLWNAVFQPWWKTLTVQVINLKRAPTKCTRPDKNTLNHYRLMSCNIWYKHGGMKNCQFYDAMSQDMGHYLARYSAFPAADRGTPDCSTGLGAPPMLRQRWLHSLGQGSRLSLRQKSMSAEAGESCHQLGSQQPLPKTYEIEGNTRTNRMKKRYTKYIQIHPNETWPFLGNIQYIRLYRNI